MKIIFKPGQIQELATPRLRLRRWRDEDLSAFAELNADPRVMEHFPAQLSREESDAMAGRIQAKMQAQGFGLWAIEVIGGPSFIGFTGLIIPDFQAHFTPCVEIGWRLSQSQWGKGYAPEAAGECLRFAFEELQLHEVVAMTVPANLRSRRVMEKLGMTYHARDDFDHPKIADGHPLKRHVLYRLARPAVHR